jgi:hypothetical protein
MAMCDGKNGYDDVRAIGLSKGYESSISEGRGGKA